MTFNNHSCTGVDKTLTQFFCAYVLLFFTNGFLPRVRARALHAPVILGSVTSKTGRCAPPPPPIAASLLLSSSLLRKLKHYTRMRYNVYWISDPNRFLLGISSYLHSLRFRSLQTSRVRFLSCLWGTFSLGWANCATYNRCWVSQWERKGD